MHRLLMFDKLNKNEFVDHINRNKLDNRKCNLRIVDISKNNQNRGKINFNRKAIKTSKYKGVFWDKNKWRVAITFKGKKIYLGRYDNENEAGKIYNENAIRYFGKNAFQNVIK